MKSLYSLYKKSTGICTDTRKIKDGCLFFALKGENFDGNDYIEDALKKGAAFAVGESSFEGEDLQDRVIQVDDSLRTLQELANYHRNQLDIPVIGITGSNGKTTCKELLHQSLSTQYKCFSTPGNFNNHIGVPLSLLQIDSSHEVAVLEFGDNHPGEIKMLCEISEPTHCFLTNIGKDHIEGFGTYENNVLAKKELFDHAKAHSLLCFVDPMEKEVFELSEFLDDRIIFPKESEIHYYTENAFIAMSYQGNSYVTRLVGDYNQRNIDAAFHISQHFGVDPFDALQAISQYQPENNRSQLIEKESNSIYLDAYNANPSSMELALKSFSKLNLKATSVVIIGDMLELGTLSKNEHKSILELCKQLHFDRIIAVGSEFQQAGISAEIEHFDQSTSLKAYLEKHPIKNAQILLKGSRGIKLETLVDVL